MSIIITSGKRLDVALSVYKEWWRLDDFVKNTKLA